MASIDITDLVEKMRDTFVKAETEVIYAMATANLPWLGLPIIGLVFKKVIEWMLTIATRGAVMQAFFANTAIRKSSQAQDYIDAIAAKASVSPTATDEEYKKYEQAEIAAFNEFVRVTT